MSGWGNIFENNENSMFSKTNMNTAFRNAALGGLGGQFGGMGLNQTGQPQGNNGGGLGDVGYIVQDPNREDLSGFQNNYYENTFNDFAWE